MYAFKKVTSHLVNSATSGWMIDVKRQYSTRMYGYDDVFNVL